MATVIDSLFQIRDNITPTKVAMFQCAGISPMTTRTFSFQDRDGTLALLDDLVGLDHGGLTGLTDDDHAGYLLLAGRVGGMSGSWFDTAAPYFTLNTGRAVADGPLATAIWRFRTSDNATIFQVGDDAATIISVPYNTYASGNPIALSLEMADATTSGSTFFRIRTNGSNVFTVSYHGGTAINMTAADTAFIITPFSTSSNCLVIRNSALATTVSVSDQGVTTIIPSHTTTTQPGLVVQRSSAAAAVIAEFRNSAAAATIRVDSIGRLIGGANNAGASLSFTSTGSIMAIPSSGGGAALTSIFSQTTGWNGGTPTNGLWRLEPTLSDPAGVGGPGVNSTTMFRINATVSDAAGLQIGLQSNVIISDNSGIGGGGGSAQGLDFNVSTTGSGNHPSIEGLRGITLHGSSGTLTGMAGLVGIVRANTGAGTVGIAKAVVSDCLTNANITEFVSTYVGMPTVMGGATVALATGVYIEYKGSGLTNPFSIVAGSTASPTLGHPSKHAGNFYIGRTDTTPTARLHIEAGNTAAGTAPIKLTSGTSMTAAEVGAFEYTTDDLFFTISTGTARKRILFADPTGGLTSGRVPFVTTNGRLTDDADMTFTGGDTLNVTKAVVSTSIQVGGGAVLPILDAGTYTPTLTGVANVTGSTAYQCQYMRVGNVVTVSGKVDVDPTSVSTLTQLGISLPVASNIGAEEDCAGAAGAPAITTADGGAIRGDAANNRAELAFTVGTDVANNSWFFTFSYEVI